MSDSDMLIDGFYKHYIKIRPDGCIIDGWSDGPNATRDTDNAICIDECGSYHFRLVIYDAYGVPLYKWNGIEVVERAMKDIEAERSTILDSSPTVQEQLRADIDFLAAMTGVVL